MDIRNLWDGILDALLTRCTLVVSFYSEQGLHVAPQVWAHVHRLEEIARGLDDASVREHRLPSSVGAGELRK